MTTRRTTILLDADLLDRLERAVRTLGTTKTAVIAEAVDAWLEANGPSTDLGFVGYGRSGHGRLSIDGRSIVRREQGRGGR
jgi:hypothetical protein